MELSMGNIMPIKQEYDSERAHRIVAMVLLALVCAMSIQVYYLQKDVIKLYHMTHSLDNENAVQGNAIHKIVKRINGQ
jgi:hypothetical protein